MKIHFRILIISVMLMLGLGAIASCLYFMPSQYSLATEAVREENNGDFLDFEQAIIDMNKNNGNSTRPNEQTGDSSQPSQSEFELKRLIVTGELKNDFGAISVVSYGDLNILSYESEAMTEYAYNQLILDSSLTVMIDKIVSTEQYAEINYDYSKLGYKNWGAEATDVHGYRQYLIDEEIDKEVVVVVIDTGLNTSHEMFQDRLLKTNGKIRGYSYFESYYQYSANDLYYEDSNEYSFEDDGGHGTHVAGIICNLTPSNVKILPIKIGDPSRNNNSSNTIMLAAFLRVLNVYSEEFNIVCANLSYSGGGKSNESDRDSFNTSCYAPLKEKGILCVTSAGNGAVEMNLDGLEAIVVSSLKNGAEGYMYDASYSNFGKIIDISAPGTKINSAWINSTNGANSTIYNNIQGTSMASPQVAGIVALLYLYPALQGSSAYEIEQALYDYCLDLGEPGKDIYYGHGIANIKFFEVNEEITETLLFYNNDTLVDYYCNYENYDIAFNLAIKCSDPTYQIIFTTDYTIPGLNKQSYTSSLAVNDMVFVYAMGVKMENGQIVERTALYNISYFNANSPIEDYFTINSSGVIDGYKGSFNTLEIPQYIRGIQVKQIDTRLFFNDTHLEKITIPASCTKINGYAFYNCTKLKYFYAPGVTKIFIAAFYNCTSLPFATDEEPAQGAEEGCYLPSLKETISFSFAYCENLKYVRFENLVLASDQKGYDFAFCYSLEEAHLPALTTIPYACFYQCASLESFTISKNVETIGEYAFMENKIKTFVVESGNNYFYTDGYGLYDSSTIIAYAGGSTGDYAVLNSVTINGTKTTITTLGQYSLAYCIFKNLTIPASIKFIDKFAVRSSTIDTLYYCATSASSILYSDATPISPPFSYTIIGDVIIADNVSIVPNRLFTYSTPSNIFINSDYTTFETNGFCLNTKNAMYDIYLEFENTTSTSWLSSLRSAGTSIYLETLFSKTQLPTGWKNYIYKDYVGYANGYHVYTDNHVLIKTSVTGAGSINPGGPISVVKGENKTFKMTPDYGWELVDVEIDGESVGAVAEYTFNNLSDDHSIHAIFERQKFSIVSTIDTGANGSITPLGESFVEYEGSLKVSFKPNNRYHISAIIIDDTALSGIDFSAAVQNGYYEFIDISSNHTIHVEFSINTYSISTSVSGNGTISPSEAQVEDGASQKFTFSPQTGYHVSLIKIDGVLLSGIKLEAAIANGYEFTEVTENHFIHVEFEIDTFEIQASSIGAGTISKNGTTIVNYGSNYTYYFYPQTGYKIKDVRVNGTSVALATSYTFTNITSNQEIIVEFEIITFNIRVSSGANGTASPIGKFNADYGSTHIITFLPDENYGVLYIEVNGEKIAPEEKLTLSFVTEDKSVYVAFAPVYLIISYSDLNGAITPSSYIIEGGEARIDFYPNEGYKVKDVKVDNISMGAVDFYVFSDISEPHTISVEFEIIKYNISIDLTGKAIIECDGELENVCHGENRTITIKIEFGRSISEVIVNGHVYEALGNKIVLEDIDQNFQINIIVKEEATLICILISLCCLSIVIPTIYLIVKLSKKIKMKKFEDYL